MTNHDTGATLLYQGQRVSCEWQSRQPRSSTSWTSVGVCATAINVRAGSVGGLVRAGRASWITQAPTMSMSEALRTSRPLPLASLTIFSSTASTSWHCRDRGYPTTDRELFDLSSAQLRESLRLVAARTRPGDRTRVLVRQVCRATGGATASRHRDDEQTRVQSRMPQPDADPPDDRNRGSLVLLRSPPPHRHSWA